MMTLPSQQTSNRSHSNMVSGMHRNNTTNDVVSAMVRLNEKGLSVPFKIEDLKKLPKIPNTGTRVKKQVIAEHLPMTA